MRNAHQTLRTTCGTSQTSRNVEGGMSTPVQESATIGGTTPSQSPDLVGIIHHRTRNMVTPVTYLARRVLINQYHTETPDASPEYRGGWNRQCTSARRGELCRPIGNERILFYWSAWFGFPSFVGCSGFPSFAGFSGFTFMA